MEEWKKVKDFITPGNLIKLGNPSYSTIAACLDILDEYHNGPAREVDNSTQVHLIKRQIGRLLYIYSIYQLNFEC